MAYVVKVYNGSTWDTGILKVWDGAAWQEKAKIWNGSSWVELYPAGGDTLALTTLSGSFFDTPGPITSGFRFNASGTIEEIGPGLTDYNVVNTGEWIDSFSATSASDYEIACTAIASGSWDVAAAGTGAYVGLGTSRVWRVTRTAMEGTGVDAVNSTFRIREIADTANFVEATVTASAEIT